MTTATVSDDTPTSVLPEIGMSFTSKSAVQNFMESFQDNVKMVYTIRDSKVFKIDDPLRTTLYWREVTFYCKHGGHGFRNEGHGERNTR